MFERKLRTLLSLAVLAVAALSAGHPCEAADVSSSGTGDLTRLQRSMLAISRQLVTVKTQLVEEFATLDAIETRIRNGEDLDSIPRELQESSTRIDAIDDTVVKLDKSAEAIGVRLTKIRDDAQRRRDEQLVRAAEHLLAQLAELQANIEIAADDVTFARETVRRLRDMLG